jgi:Tfp pilus assembly protein PilV
MNQKEQQRRRFRLIAALIFMFSLSTALLGMSSMVFSVIRATTQSKEMTAATTQLQDKSEDLKTPKYKIAHLKK